MECLSVLLLSVTVSKLHSCSDNKLPQTTQVAEASQLSRCQCMMMSSHMQLPSCQIVSQHCAEPTAAQRMVHGQVLCRGRLHTCSSPQATHLIKPAGYTPGQAQRQP